MFSLCLKLDDCLFAEKERQGAWDGDRFRRYVSLGVSVTPSLVKCVFDEMIRPNIGALGRRNNIISWILLIAEIILRNWSCNDLS